MSLTKAELDAALDREYTFGVEVSEDAPLPRGRVYDPVRQIVRNGLKIRLRELLHAIGSKTANLPVNRQDEAIAASLKYSYLLDLTGDHLTFLPYDESDFVTAQSQEIGVGMTCLLVRKLYSIPWDQLEPLPGPGLRFDYRGRRNRFDGIFESKGTRYRGNQNGQIEHGIEKKEAHHERGETFNAELIVSTFIGWQGTVPRILIGDPSFDKLAEIYSETRDEFFTLRHYSRILQFIGLPATAYWLNRFARTYLNGAHTDTQRVRDRIAERIALEKRDIRFLEPQLLNEQRFVGRWFSTIRPPTSRRFRKSSFPRADEIPYTEPKGRRVFQGLRDDVYQSLLRLDPIKDVARDETVSLGEDRASIFADGTIQIFRQD